MNRVRLGVGPASDVSEAMELGCDVALLKTAIATTHAALRVAYAMKYVYREGRHSSLAGRILKKLHATASSQ